MKRALLLLQLVAVTSCATRPSSVSTGKVASDIHRATEVNQSALSTTREVNASVSHAESTADRIDDKLVLYLEHYKATHPTK